MENYNKISPTSLKLIPLDGKDLNISCGNCPASCCRENEKLPLSNEEAQFLIENGTKLTKLKHGVVRDIINRVFRNDIYNLDSDCGNLLVDPVTRKTSCQAHEDLRRPRVCGEFPEGSFQCGQTQLVRVISEIDVFVDRTDDEKGAVRS